MQYLELLAPARNADIGIAAVDCGADAVYIAGPAFGARKDAGNPVSEIGRLCRYAHKFGARVFVTFNILLRDEELELCHSQMLECQQAGADAFIIRDLRICGWKDITLPLHASTQCSIRTVQRALLFQDAGCSRVVLERELPPQTIAQICSALTCEVECFVHGALCVCYSGQCLMSEALTGRSADRGECIQACRNLYDLVSESGRTYARNKALLSLKDLNLLAHLEELASMGVCSFKIEGRLKNISYVRNVVREYSLKLDSLVARHPERYRRASFGRVVKGFEPSLDKTFNRSYTPLFFGEGKGSWANTDAAKSMGENLGKVLSVKKLPSGTTEIRLADSSMHLANGDGFAFIKGSSIIGFRGDVCEGGRIRCSGADGLMPGMLLFRNFNAAFEKSLSREQCQRFINVKVSLSCSGGEILARALSEDGREAFAGLSGLEPALDAERAVAMYKSQLEKSSEHYTFSLEEISGQALHCSASALNSLRRSFAEALDALDVRGLPLQNLPRTGEVLQPADTGRRPGELMRSSYCIRKQLGMCLKDGAPAERLYLVNNRRRFPLSFDCAACEMAVMEQSL